MIENDKPIVICAPEPRTLDLIFAPEQLETLKARYDLRETTGQELPSLAEDVLARARYVLGQPPISQDLLRRMESLRAVLNVESNLIDNMPYEDVFRRGIHVLTTGAVFAAPVAELGIALALNLARGVIEADTDFRHAREKWGGEGNADARLLSGSEIGLIGFGDLGKAINRLLSGFRATIRVYDPWLPPSILIDQGVVPADLDTVLSRSDTVFVLAAVTSENRGFLNARRLAQMRQKAALVLLSRADVVDFDALVDAVQAGRILDASDVFPIEPLPADHRVRQLDGFIRSAHRAGALDSAFKRMGDMVLEDMALMDKRLPPMRCKRAERETAGLMRSRPVETN